MEQTNFSSLNSEYRTSNLKKVVSKFTFDESIAKQFDDMAYRSIPGYYSTQQLSISLAKQYAVANSRIYDIGSATGTTLIKIAKNLLSSEQNYLNSFATPKSVQLIGIEPSAAMRAKCIEKFRLADYEPPLLLVDPIEKVMLKDCSLALLNYTLHFTQVAMRPSILSGIYQGLLPGGALVLAEKISSSSPIRNSLWRKKYHFFKQLNGYSIEEIRHKELALKGVLTPLTVCENIALLKQAGFKKIIKAIYCPPFCTFVAFK